MPSYNDSLDATKAKLSLGYGDTVLIAMQLVNCLEYELAQRDERIAALEDRLSVLEAQ